MLKSGDHVLVGDDVYGGTFRIFDKVLTQFGLEATLPRHERPARGSTRPCGRTRGSSGWRRRATRCSRSSTSRRSPRSRARGASSLAVDNTFATPMLQRPLALGASLSVHSTTKYLNGHSDVVGGAVMTSDDGARRAAPLPAEVGRGRAEPVRLLPGAARPQDARRAHEAARARAPRIVADCLAGHPRVARVRYPGLASHEGHALAARQMSGPGGMISVRAERARSSRPCAFLRALRIFACAESLGGVESLAEHPAHHDAREPTRRGAPRARHRRRPHSPLGRPRRPGGPRRGSRPRLLPGAVDCTHRVPARVCCAGSLSQGRSHDDRPKLQVRRMARAARVRVCGRLLEDARHRDRLRQRHAGGSGTAVPASGAHCRGGRGHDAPATCPTTFAEGSSGLSINCRVSPNGDGFDIQLDASQPGSEGGELTISGHVDHRRQRRQGDRAVREPDGRRRVRASDCDVTYVVPSDSPSRRTSARSPGSFFGHISCPNAMNAGGSISGQQVIGPDGGSQRGLRRRSRRALPELRSVAAPQVERRRRIARRSRRRGTDQAERAPVDELCGSQVVVGVGLGAGVP